MTSSANQTDRLPARVGSSDKEVFSDNNLPDITSNIIVLESSKDYLLRGAVSIPADTQVQTGAGTRFAANNASNKQLIGNTASLPLFIDDGGSGVVALRTGFVQLGADELMEITANEITGQSLYEGCVFAGGAVRIKNIESAFFEKCVFANGAYLVVDSAAGISDLRFVDCRFIDAAAMNMLDIEAGAVVNNISYTGCSAKLTFASNAINFGNGCTVNSLKVLDCRFDSEHAAATVLNAANPEDVKRAIVQNNNWSEIGFFYGTSPTITSVVDLGPTGITDPGGIAIDNDGNMYIAAANFDDIEKFTGISNTFDSAIAMPGTSGGGGPLAWSGGLLYSVNMTDGTCYAHDGFVATAVPPITGNIAGVAFHGQQIMTLNSSTDNVDVRDGSFTNVVDYSFASGTASGRGLAQDGFNAFVNVPASGQTIVKVGASADEQYSFTVSSNDITDIVAYDGGYLLLDKQNLEVKYIEHSVTMGPESPTWDFQNNSGVRNSSPRGGFEWMDIDSPVSFDVGATGEWLDISAPGIAYTPFAENSKYIAKDNTNGLLECNNAQTLGRSYRARVLIKRSSSGGDQTYQVAYAVNDRVVRDSIGTLKISSNTDSFDLRSGTPKVDVGPTDEVKPLLRNAGGTEDPLISVVVLEALD